MRRRASIESPVVDLWNREVGRISTRKFAHRLAASEDLVLRLDLLHKLDKHLGCVNTVSFSDTGDILVSGSDDRRIILWDWETGHIKLSFHSDHHNNVFQAKIMPFTEDRSIVSCAADGQVRHAQLLDGGKVETKLVAKHQRRAHKLAVEPGSPYIFYTCGEDGLVQHIDLRTGIATALFTCKAVQTAISPFTVQLNTIAVDPRNPNLFAVAGSDEFARLYDIRKHKWDASSEFGLPVNFFCPSHLLEDDNAGITGLAFSDQSELLVSYSDEFIYLFTKDNGLGPDPNTFTTGVSDASSSSSLSNVDDNSESAPQAYRGHMNCETVKGVSFFGPKCEYVVSGSDCGRIFIWKKNGGKLIRVIKADKHVVNCIESHPHVPILASSGVEHDIKIWIPKATNRAILPTNIQMDSAHTPRGSGFYLIDDSDDEDEDEDDDFIDIDDDNDGDYDDEDGDSDDDDMDGDSDDDDGNVDIVIDRHGDYCRDDVLNEEHMDGGDENDCVDLILIESSDDDDDGVGFDD